jgi:hypothetical protein
VRRKYKIVRAPSLDALEARVSLWLESDASDGYELLGHPTKFAHEEYAQAFINNYEVI